MNVAYIVLGIDGAMCTSGTISMWCHVQVVLCKFHAYGVVYVWFCVPIMHMVLCMSDVVYTLYRWYNVHVVLCTCCAGGAMYM